MPLSDNVKIGELANQFALLADLEEPEALIAVMARACRRKAQGAITPNLAKRWQILANALLEAEVTVNAAQAPDARKLAEQAAPDAQRPTDPA
jgi:hypothetical protein